MLEMVGAVVVAAILYYLYQRFHEVRQIWKKWWKEEPVVAAEKTTLPPTTAIPVMQQPSTVQSLFQSIGTDVLNTLFNKDPPTVGGRGSI